MAACFVLYGSAAAFSPSTSGRSPLRVVWCALLRPRPGVLSNLVVELWGLWKFGNLFVSHDSFVLCLLVLHLLLLSGCLWLWAEEILQGVVVRKAAY